MKNIHDVIDLLKTDPQGISLKFGIPLRTVYSWCSGERQPPEYIIIMMLQIILYERRLAIYGDTEKELAKGMGNDSSKGS
ncbi:MAG: hypothetical protein J6S67_24525 [Methanobrevibacter sp.]|nr:hypothetical protein [Methanobrevibacter sp.]